VISEASFAMLLKYAVLVHHEGLALLGFWILPIVLYPEQQTGFWKLVVFVFSDTKVWRLLSIETDPVSGTFCSVQNIRRWTKFRNPVILNVIHDCWIPLEVTA
jgi:hypothetical protein